MIKEEKLIEWFDEKLQNCYHIVKDNGDVIWVYDKNYIRMLKLAQIDGRTVETPVYDKNKVLFYQNQKYKWFECDDEIWLFLENCLHSNSNDNEVQLFITDSLENIGLKELVAVYGVFGSTIY